MAQSPYSHILHGGSNCCMAAFTAEGSLPVALPCVLLCRIFLLFSPVQEAHLPCILQAHMAVVAAPRWPLLQGYGGAHLAVMYLAAAAALPGLQLERRAERRWPEAGVEDALRVAGLWCPRPLGNMAPVLAAVVLVGCDDPPGHTCRAELQISRSISGARCNAN